MDVFVRDLQSQTTERVSVSSSEAQATGGGGGSFDPGISYDGSRVVFDSNETSLWPGTSPLIRHVYMRDRTAGTTTLLSMATDGLPADTIPSPLTDAASQDPSISSDGQWVVFHSQSPDLVNGDGDNVEDLFRVPATGGTVTRIATNVGEGMGEGANVQVSSTGRYVTYSSASSGTRQVYRYDADTATSTVFSVSTAGANGNNASQDAVISDDGKAVAFLSQATNLAGTVTGGTNVYVRTVA
jgi:Tol biopolymer transport system component